MFTKHFNKLTIKKVLHIIHNAGAGGAQVLLLDLFQQWSGAAVELILVTHLEGHYVEDYKATGYKVYTIDFEQPSGGLLQSLRKIIKQEQPDYIHNHLWKAVLLGSSLGLLFSKAIIYNQIHGVVADTDRAAWKLSIYKRLLKALGQTSCRFIAVSAYEASRLKEGGIQSEKLQILYNGVQTEKFTFPPLPYHKETVLKLLFVGRLEPVKGIIYLLEAVRNLESNSIQLSIVGDGNLREELETYCEMNAITQVHFLGFQKNVRTLIAEHHVFVAPSLWEVFGISIAEAMAMGKAVIASRVGGVPELIIDEKGGYLCPPADANALREAILKIQKEPERLAEFGAFNRARFLELFTLDRTIKELEILYEK